MIALRFLQYASCSSASIARLPDTNRVSSVNRFWLPRIVERRTTTSAAFSSSSSSMYMLFLLSSRSLLSSASPGSSSTSSASTPEAEAAVAGLLAAVEKSRRGVGGVVTHAAWAANNTEGMCGASPDRAAVAD